MLIMDYNMYYLFNTQSSIIRKSLTLNFDLSKYIEILKKKHQYQ